MDQDDSQVSKSGQDLLNLVELIQKYQLRHTRELGQLISAKGKDNSLPMQERLTLLNLYSKSTYGTLAKKAFKLVEMQESSLRFNDLMKKYEDNIKERFNKKADFLYVQSSILVLDDILNWNKIDNKKFLQDLWNVLNKEMVKLNTFVLEGPCNAGKSLLIWSIAQISRFVGEVVLSEGSSFNWQNCCNNSLNIFEEPRIGPATVKHFKLIAEGAST